MTEKKLLNRIEDTKLSGLYYNTACLKVSADLDFDEVYEEMLHFVKDTNAEKGCIEFFAAPGNLAHKEIMLWEVWENEAALNAHMDEAHTKKILSKNLIELQWSRSANLSR